MATVENLNLIDSIKEIISEYYNKLRRLYL